MEHPSPPPAYPPNPDPSTLTVVSGISYRIACPDCGEVRLEPDVFGHGKPVSALCPSCGDRLYFEGAVPFDLKATAPGVPLADVRGSIASNFDREARRPPPRGTKP